MATGNETLAQGTRVHAGRGTRRRAPQRGPARRPGATRPLLTLVLLAGVLVAGRTPQAASAVAWLRDFLEFFVGVFTLLAATAAAVAGVAAAQRALPIRMRILAQGAHRATAVMAVGFLVAHIVLKVMEAHASVLDAFLPFVGAHGRVLYIGLGTIAGDLLVLIVATGVMRGRFVGQGRPWVWRALHSSAYLMWAVAIVHGLLAGRPAAAWVTWSYVICFAVVVVAAASRLPRMLRDRRMLRARKAKGDFRIPSFGSPAGRRATADLGGGTSGDIPDEDFWSALRAEAGPWIGKRR